MLEIKLFIVQCVCVINMPLFPRPLGTSCLFTPSEHSSNLSDQLNRSTCQNS